MGYELWTSPLTGYRRKGTRFDSLKKLFIENITALCIFEPLLCCPLSSDSLEAKETLVKRDFDIAGVKSDISGPVIGYVKTSELSGGVFKNYVRKIEISNVVSDSTPLANIINVFNENEFVFVLSSNQINGIITKADINKPPVRIYLFGMVSLLEMHLNLWISNHYQNEIWKGLIKGDRVAKAEEVFKKRKGENQELTLLECIQLCDKKEILINSDKFLEKFGFSKKGFQGFINRAEKIRNELAHSQISIISSMKWNKFSKTIDNAGHFLTASDLEIEKNAREGVDFRDTLI
jgi:hypothetical protein